jgi:DNA-binding SARP family transcriptional activator
LSLAFFGGFAINLDGAPVTDFDSSKVRALLAFLAVESARAHRRESLAALLWPGYPDRSARTNLRNALANLRTAIGDREAEPPFLLITRETLQFNRESDHWLDVEVFSQTLPRVDQVPIERLAEVADFYMGDFFAGFTLEDAVSFDDWISVTGVRLRRQALELLGKLVDRLEAAGDLDRALTYAWKRLEVDRWREEVHRQVMALLAMTGQRSAALAQYGVCRRMLADEIGVDPEPATLALVEKIKSGTLSDDSRQRAESGPLHSVDAGARPRDHPAAATTAALRHNLPAQITPCLGREREVAEILRMVTAGSCCLITLAGPGGIGKTRLALEVADHLIGGRPGPASFPDGVFFVPLAGEASAPANPSRRGFWRTCVIRACSWCWTTSSI